MGDFTSWKLARTFSLPRFHPQEKGLYWGMECPKCRQQNPETAQYCLRCHTPVRYVCPACKHKQLVGGKCEQCGVDFAKYAVMLQFQAQSQAQLKRQRAKTRQSIIKQILLLPVTGGLSLLGFLRSRFRGE